MAAKALADLEPAPTRGRPSTSATSRRRTRWTRPRARRPLWQALANLDQAKSNYGAIVYNKAPAVLKQLEYLVGDSAFQAGVRRFLDAHAYGNATWRDLLGAVGARGAAAARRVRAGLHAARRACRWSSSGWSARRTGSRGSTAERPARPAQPSGSSGRRRRRPGPSAPRSCSPTATGRRCGIPVELHGTVTDVAAAARPCPRPTSSSPTRATTATSSCCSTRPASRALERGALGQRGRRVPPRHALGRAVGPGARLPDGAGALRAARPPRAAARDRRADRAGRPGSAGSGRRAPTCGRRPATRVQPRGGARPAGRAPADTDAPLRRAQGLRRRVHRARRVAARHRPARLAALRPTRWPASRSAIRPAGTS